MDLGIKKTIDSGNGNTLIYTALIAAAVANFLPTPADAVYFWRQSVDKKRLEAGEITPKKYWINDVLGYYGYTAAYYTIVLATVASIGSTYKTKSRVLIALAAGGLVVGVVAKNIQRDTIESKQEIPVKS